MTEQIEDDAAPGAGRPSRWRCFSSAAQEQQLRHLTQSARLEEGSDPRGATLVAYAISACVLIFFAWAGAKKVIEVARAPGQIVPLGFEQVVQHLDGGIISQILAREGEVVEEGEVLAVLDGAGTREDLTRATERQWALEVRAERLRAFVEDRQPDFSRFAAVETSLIDRQRDIFEGTIEARDSQADVIRNQISLKRQDLAILRTRLSTNGEKLGALNELNQMYDSLNKLGHASDLKLIEVHQQELDLTGENDAIRQQMLRGAIAIEEFESRLGSLRAVQKDETYRELHDVEAELAQNRQTIEKLERQVERLQVRAPTRGVVSGLAINTVGGVVQPGQTLMSIVPLNAQLVADIRILPRDIGHVRVGQQVQVKISAFDYTRYGASAGRLETISPSTFRSDDGGRYYRGRVRFDTEQAGAEPSTMSVMAGMTVTADIVTGQRTILEYLLTPVRDALASSFSER